MVGPLGDGLVVRDAERLLRGRLLQARLPVEPRAETSSGREQRVDERIPTAYILGEAWLGDFRFTVDPRVIVPRSFIAEVLAMGIRHMAFGDLFLEDVRAYREKQLAGTGIAPLFPLWGSDTRELAQQMMAAGLKARICTLDPGKLDASLGGHGFDPALLAALPAGVDPCGENGEFHTLAFDGPMFQRPLAIRVGETVVRDGFVFTDLLPDETPEG